MYFINLFKCKVNFVRALASCMPNAKFLVFDIPNTKHKL